MNDKISWQLSMYLDCNNAGEVARQLKDWSLTLGGKREEISDDYSEVEGVFPDG